jgi:hypothetical protein
MKISILSSDTLFARMLMLEIEGLRKNFSVRLNDHDLANGNDIVILDLDSPYANGAFETPNIIGFSKNERSVPQKNSDKCRVLFHRPFLTSKFLQAVESLAAGREYSQIARTEPSGPRLAFMRDGLVTLDGRGIHMSENEYSLLLKLYENVGLPVSREELGGALSSNDGNICDVYICKLRAKLEAGRSERLIYTVRSKGYMLKL